MSASRGNALVRAVLVPVLAIVALVAIVAAVATGPGSGLRAAVGGLLAWAVLAGSLRVLDPVARANAAASLPLALLLYSLTSVVLVGLVLGLVESGWVGSRVDLGWFAAAMVLTSLAWVALHLRAFLRDRTPTYDLRNNP